MKVVSGSSNLKLAQGIASQLGGNVIEIEIEKFSNGEKRIRILENLKDEEVYLVQSFLPNTDEYLIETLLLSDAIKRLGAKKIIGIFPWLSYSPQDKVFREGEPLSSEVIVRVLEHHIDEFLLLDIHSELVLKMFSKKFKHL